MRASVLALTLSLALGAPLALTLSCGSGGVVGGSCRPGLTECDGRCVNIGSDAEHCGLCNNSCGADERCLVGVCIGAPGPAVVNNLDGGVLLPDGAILLPDGATVRPDGAPLGNGGGGNGGNGGCEPPYNTAERCGDCSTSCDSALPLCSPAGTSFECSNACEEGLLACDNRCIDPLTDPDHCGSCGRRCPTAICRDGACVGGTAGHVVSMCMNFETFRLNAPQNTLLGNAVFQASADPVRVLGYVESATARGIIGVERALAEADDKNGRDIQLTRARQASLVTDALSGQTHDAILIYDQGLAPAGTLAQLAQTWAPALASYTLAGGIVIVLSSSTGTAEMHELLSGSGLMPGLTGLTEATGATLYNRAPSDAVGLRVSSEFRGLGSSCRFVTGGTPETAATWVITDAPGGSADASGSPVVVHGVVTEP